MLRQVVSRGCSSCQTKETAREEVLRRVFRRKTRRKIFSRRARGRRTPRGARKTKSGGRAKPFDRRKRRERRRKKFRASDRRCASRAPNKLTPQIRGLEYSSLPVVSRVGGRARLRRRNGE